MTFKELLELLRNPPEDGLPADLADQLQTAYDGDVATYTSSATNALSQLQGMQEKLTAAEAAKQVAQEHNAKLLKSIPAYGDNDNPGDSDTDDDGDDPFESNTTVESMTEYL